MSSEQESHQLAKEVNRGRRRQLFRWSASVGMLMIVVLATTLIVISIKANDLIDRFGDLRSRVQQVESSVDVVEARAAGFQGVLDNMAATLDGFLAELRKLIRTNN